MPPDTPQPEVRVLTFYPRTGDGSALTFSIADITSEAMAALFAKQLFDTHATAVEIEVFEGEHRIGVFRAADLRR